MVKNWNLKVGDKIYKFDSPIVMGILNVTPDSFYDGGKYNNEKNILNRTEQIISEGAKIIDIGAFSTRPGAEDVDEIEEYNRLRNALTCIKKEYPNQLISIDTFRANTALKIIEEFGNCIINDISGGTMDNNMFKTVAKLNATYIMMHIQGTPQTMQKNPFYKNVTQDVYHFFEKRIHQLKQLGACNIIVDLGFGFGKTIDHNYELMKNHNQFTQLNLPILTGISRKSMIYKFIGGTPDSSLNGTSVLNTIAINKGANILRVHDVKEAVEVITLSKKINDI